MFSQRGPKRVGAVGRDRDLDDACEGSGELGELAVLPVAAMGVDDRGDRGDESRTIVADDGEHKRCHGFSVPSASDSRSYRRPRANSA